MRRTFSAILSLEKVLQWLDEFLQQRFELFGPYEDALSNRGRFLFHSGLSPMLNSGLLTPQEVVERAVEIGQKKGFP